MTGVQTCALPISENLVTFESESILCIPFPSSFSLCPQKSRDSQDAGKICSNQILTRLFLQGENLHCDILEIKIEIGEYIVLFSLL